RRVDLLVIRQLRDLRRRSRLRQFALHRRVDVGPQRSAATVAAISLRLRRRRRLRPVQRAGNVGAVNDVEIDARRYAQGRWTKYSGIEVADSRWIAMRPRVASDLTAVCAPRLDKP